MSLLERVMRCWTRNWSWIALPIMLTIIGIAYVSPRITSAMFCTRDEACIREWFTAGIGFVAVGAAAATIRAMSLQREDANRHQLYGLELEVLARLALARRVRSLLVKTIESTQKLLDDTNIEARSPGLPNNETHWGAFGAWNESIMDWWSNPASVEYFEKIGVDAEPQDIKIRLKAVSAMKAIERYKGYANFRVSWPSEADAAEKEAFERVTETYVLSLAYASIVRIEVDDFIAKWSRRLAEEIG